MRPGILADAPAQCLVFNQALEIGDEQRVCVSVQRNLDDRITGELAVPTCVANYAAHTRSHQATETGAGFADCALAKVECDVGLVDVPLELIQSYVAAN